MTTVVIIQARLGSRRFPRKVLAPLGDRPVIQHVVERATAIPGVEKVVIAIPDGDTELDLLLLGVERLTGCTTFRDAGYDETDVLGRYARAAAWASADVIIRLTGDCPLLDARLCEMVVEQFAKSGADYVSNCYPSRTFPDGVDCEAFTVSLLRAAHEAATDPYEREHVTAWMRARVGVPMPCISVDPSYDHLRWTVDTPADLAYLNRLYAHIPPGETSWQATLATAEALEELIPQDRKEIT